MTLMAIARSQPDTPALLREAQVLLNRHSYYDDLLPVATQRESRQSRFAAPQLRETQAGADRYMMHTTERDGLAARADVAWFTALEGGDKISFELPERPADSLLRIVITGHQSPAGLQLFMDKRPPLQLRLDRKTLTDPARYALNAAGALAAQATNADSDTAWQLSVQQTRPAAVLELSLPRTVKNIRIRRSDNGPQPLSLALQYRVARPWRLSDASYLQLLDVLRAESALQPLLHACLVDIDTALDQDARIPEQLLSGQSLSEHARSAARAVVNHWTPLLRRLRARQQSYRAGIDNNWQPAQHALTSNAVNDILAGAKRAERAGHWLPALEYWRHLLESKQSRHRQAALSGMLRALLELGEYLLAEHLLRGSYLNDTPADLQAQRYTQTRALYRQQNNRIAQEGLLATALSRSPDPERLSELATQLVDAGRLQDALTIGVLLPAGHRPHDRLLAVAIHQQAWPAFEHLLSDVSDAQERAVWLGYRDWALNDTERAYRHWENAGSTGHTLIEKSREGQQILAALLHGNATRARRATTGRLAAATARPPALATDDRTGAGQGRDGLAVHRRPRSRFQHLACQARATCATAY